MSMGCLESIEQVFITQRRHCPMNKCHVTRDWSALCMSRLVIEINVSRKHFFFNFKNKMVRARRNLRNQHISFLLCRGNYSPKW